MSNLVLALSLYLGLGAFFGVIATALIIGASLPTALMRAFAAILIFVFLGWVASLATRVKAKQSEC